MWQKAHCSSDLLRMNIDPQGRVVFSVEAALWEMLFTLLALLKALDTSTAPRFASWTEETLLHLWWWLASLHSSISTGLSPRRKNISPDSVYPQEILTSAVVFLGWQKNYFKLKINKWRNEILNCTGNQTKYHSSKLAVFQLLAEKGAPNYKNAVANQKCNPKHIKCVEILLLISCWWGSGSSWLK